MMITKRQFVFTMLVFLILLLLFMGFQLGKSAMTSAAENQHISETGTRIADPGRKPEFAAVPDRPDGAGHAEWVLFIGRDGSKYAETAKEWSYYTGTPVVLASELPSPDAASLPDVLMLEPEYVSGQADRIAKLMGSGVDVIFLSLPDYGYLESDAALQDILGIYRTVSPETALQGIHLFDGFLLGGERVFQLSPETEERMDLSLRLPWYSVRGGAKTYMRGILPDGELAQAKERGLKDEDMPAIIWKNHYADGDAFAVNGDYILNRRIGVGMLQAMMFERSEYSLYPVINAQVFSLSTFPLLTNENLEELQRIYGRDAAKLQSDVVMPMLITLAAKHGFKPSCFLAVKHDYDSPAAPENGLLRSCLPMIGEMDGELGLSAEGLGRISPEEKADLDRQYLTSEAADYRFAAVLAPSQEVWNRFSPADGDIRSVSLSEYSDELPIVSCLDGGITCQQSTFDLSKHTFTDELELLGVQTLLAYSNSCFDMAGVFYPEAAEDEWQNISRRIFSNLTTYNAPFGLEDHLTVSESDSRLRTYFALEYRESRSGDRISLSLDKLPEQQEVHFLLRTHNEDIVSVSGGDFTKMEDGVFLISAVQSSVEIRLASTLSALVNMEGRNR